jgi:DNA (cytosine-5)-methyltransferase 1
LTIRECARIQSFDDDFEFCGTQSQQLLQVANAVPPLFAEAIGRTLINDLITIGSQDNGEKDGALLSFVPTLASGMSPILQRVTSQVEGEFMGLLHLVGDQ